MNNEQKVAELRDKLADLRAELREHGAEVDDAQCAALCETSAEVLAGLEMAFTHYLDKSEAAWQR
jgi:hypothetical protein